MERQGDIFKRRERINLVGPAGIWLEAVQDSHSMLGQNSIAGHLETEKFRVHEVSLENTNSD